MANIIKQLTNAQGSDVIHPVTSIDALTTPAIGGGG